MGPHPSNMFYIRIIVCFLFIFPAYKSYAFQSPELTVSPDSTINVLEKLVIRYRYDKPDSATYYAEKGLKFAKMNNNEEGVARMLNQLGMIDDNLGKAEDSRQKYLEALEIYKRLDIKKGIVRENIRLGVVENRKGNYAKASAYFLQALKVSEKSKDKAGIMESYITLGEVYSSQQLHQKAIGYYKKAEALSKDLPFSSLKLNIYNNMGNSYRETGDFPKAISYFEKGIGLSNYPQMMGLNITMVIGLAKVYAKSGTPDKAIQLQKDALTKSRKIDNFIREFQSLTGLADSYSTNNKPLALNYLEEARLLSKNHNAKKQVLEVLDKIAVLQAASNNYRAAYEAKNQQYTIADSFYYKDISLKISDLQARYELNKSEVRVQELRFINSKQALEQKIMMGIIAGVVILLFVLTIYFFKIRSLNQLLHKSNAALTESNTVKDKLFSVLAHDLRAPLASVINLLGMISKGWLDEEEKEVMLNKLMLHCNASMETLNLLLRWGHMQLKGIMINKIILKPAEIVDRNISLVAEAAEQKSITIRKDVPEALSVFSDADHLDFVIRNLISNAIKFTPEGGHILITAHYNVNEKEVVFMVRDNGVGIGSDRLKSIFTTGSVSTNGTNNEKGTSLGLVICKEFIQANNGKIWVESVPGSGSEFFFTLSDK
jgi:signal transduction histidine kinase